MLKKMVKRRVPVRRNRLNYREGKALTTVGAFFVIRNTNTRTKKNQMGVNMLRISRLF
jgi:hypothetical protein